MSIWLWVITVSLLVYWSIFFYLLTRRRWDASALTVGVLHMLFASALVAVPIRSFFDPNYMGFGLGLFRFEGRWATLPSAAFLIWALLSAWVAVSSGKSKWLKVIAVGDLLFAINLGADFLVDYGRGKLATSKIQGGEFFTLTGTLAGLIPLLLFALPFLASAVWAIRRIHSSGTTPPLGHGTQKEDASSAEDTKDTSGFRYSARPMASA